MTHKHTRKKSTFNKLISNICFMFRFQQLCFIHHSIINNTISQIQYLFGIGFWIENLFSCVEIIFILSTLFIILEIRIYIEFSYSS